MKKKKTKYILGFIMQVKNKWPCTVQRAVPSLSGGVNECSRVRGRDEEMGEVTVFTRCQSIWKTKEGEGGSGAGSTCYWGAVWGSLIISLGGVKVARRCNVGGRGSRCADVLVRSCSFLTQDLYHPRHLSLLTLRLCSTTTPSLSHLFSQS